MEYIKHTGEDRTGFFLKKGSQTRKETGYLLHFRPSHYFEM